ncbi:hypothetical protein GCM10009555_009190 [Acrocarpospora macrocephala]|uniref:Uncharacterized protein n=1 Tax=Acrocarpospora macrocephala TaxID=150177 RepID=A0A5M3WQM9_9ACTN|nr:hypothetical protein [Acrocarpospora macrocephala]GES10452.1 hypothetical protein Amac_040490 [Acrocarpospora macrocephala]
MTVVGNTVPAQAAVLTLMVLDGVLIAVLFERVSPELRDPTAEIVAAAR